jgi:membrane protein DedA with SNARE-associated domain
LADMLTIGKVAAEASDSGWFFAGRAGSRRLMQLYCRVSFGSTACVARTERNLIRFGARSLVYARFVPGFRTFAAPMAGMRGLPYRSFLLYDGMGALLWACLGVTTGAVFAYKIPAILDQLENSRIVLLYLAGSLKWLVRWRHGRAQLIDPPIKTPKA